MTNLFDYLLWRGDLPFSAVGFNEVDGMILSRLAYADFENAEPLRGGEASLGAVAQALAEKKAEETDDTALLRALANSERFRDLRLCDYENRFDAETQTQFSAITVRLTQALSYLAFRGTDTTLVGWKESFNMAFLCPVPSQRAAADYLARAAEKPGRFLLGGHSKGGNLAVYAAAECDRAVQDRIVRVYSHDGPGFLESVLQSDAFRRIADRIEKTLPQSSVVGMLLEHQEHYSIVRSNRVSFLQHDPFSWQVEGGSFVPFSHLTSDALYLDHTISAWLAQLSEADRERFVDALFDILSANDISTVDEWKADWPKNVPAAVRALSQMNPDTKTFLGHTLHELAALSVKNFPELLGRPALSAGRRVAETKGEKP